MQIELIGCTSAGKSTLATSILRASREQGLEISLGEDFVLKQFRLNWISSPLLRRLLVNLAGLLASLVTWPNNHRFYLFAAQLLFRLPIPRLEKMALLRNVLKKMGIYEIIRFYSAGQQIILVDEGVLQAAHNLFVHVSVEVKGEHLSTFAGLVPLPDVVVYFKQPEGLLVDRIMNRGHKRIPDRSHNKVDRFVKRAVATFDRLVQHPAVASRLLVVDGHQGAILATNFTPRPHDTTMALAPEIIRSGLATATEDIMYVEQNR